MLDTTHNFIQLKMTVSENGGIKMDGLKGTSQSKMDDLGVPPFMETSYE